MPPAFMQPWKQSRRQGSHSEHPELMSNSRYKSKNKAKGAMVEDGKQKIGKFIRYHILGLTQVTFINNH